MLARSTCALSVIAILAIIGQSVSVATAVAAPDIVVTSVYWGTNPLGGVSVHQGDTNIPLSIVLSNVGDAAARDVKAKLVLAPPLSYNYYDAGVQHSTGAVTQNAGDMLAGSSFSSRFALTVASNASSGIHRLTLVVNYKTARELLPVEKALSIDAPVWTGDARVQHVLTTPARIHPGDEQITVKVWLVNAGTGSTSDLEVRLLSEEPFTKSSAGSDVFFIGTMQPGQVSEADFFIDISDSARHGSYSLKLVANFPGSTGQSAIGEIPLYVSDKVRFEIVSVEPEILRAGDTGLSVRITVKNVGSVAADSVRVQLRVGNYFSGTVTDFLGTMMPGETRTAYFTVDADSKAHPATYRMDLRFDWTQSNYGLDDTATVELQVTQAELPIPLIAVGVILIVTVLAFVIRRIRPPPPRGPASTGSVSVTLPTQALSGKRRGGSNRCIFP